MVFMLAPLFLILVASTHSTATLQASGLPWWPGNQTLGNYAGLLTFKAGFTESVTALAMLKNSAIVAFGVAALTVCCSFCVAFALVFMRMRFARTVFFLALLTLLFPLEARFISTFELSTHLGLINTHLGIILPVLQIALGTFVFRQHLLTLPSELVEAAMLDGTGAVKFLRDFAVPLSRLPIAAVFIVTFIAGWNQYLWPLMISTDDSLYTLVRGIRLIGQRSGPGMAMVILTITPPLLLLMVFQRWFMSAINAERQQ